MNLPDTDLGTEHDRRGSTSDDHLPMSLPVELVLHDREVIAAVCAYAEGDARTRFLEMAFRVGVLALQNAAGEVDAERIRRESDRLLNSLVRHLEDHNRTVNSGVATVLKELRFRIFRTCLESAALRLNMARPRTRRSVLYYTMRVKTPAVRGGSRTSAIVLAMRLRRSSRAVPMPS